MPAKFLKKSFDYDLHWKSLKLTDCNVTRRRSHTLYIILLIIPFLAGDQLVVPRGVTHISCHYKNTIEGTGENKTNEQTRTMLGVNSRAEGELCNTFCMCRLTLAWVASETSTKQLECRLILTRSSFTGLDPISSHWSHRSGVRCRLPLSVVPRQLPASSFVQPTLFSCPVTSSGHAEISSPKTLCLVSRQNRQRNRLLGGPPM